MVCGYFQKSFSLSFALLVCNSTWSLTCRLARCLALTAATFSSSCLEISLIDSFNMFHAKFPPNQYLFLLFYHNNRNFSIVFAIKYRIFTYCTMVIHSIKLFRLFRRLAYTCINTTYASYTAA